MTSGTTRAGVLATASVLASGLLALPAQSHPGFTASPAFGFLPNTTGSTGAAGLTPPYAAGATPTLFLRVPFEQTEPFQGRDDTNVEVTAVVPRGWTQPTCVAALTLVNDASTSSTDQPGSPVPGWTCSVVTVGTNQALRWSGPQVAVGQTEADSAQYFAFTVRTPSPSVQTTYDGTRGTEGFVLDQRYASGATEHWIPSAGFVGVVPAGARTEVAGGLARTVAAAPEDCGTGSSPLEAYVQHVFRTVLERCAEPTAEAHYAGLLSRGTIARTALADRVLLTDENLGDEVVATYRRLVGRTPGTTETSHWVATARQSRDQARLPIALLGSQELFVNASQPGEGCAATADAPTPPVGREDVWLDTAYCEVLGRLPEPAGREHWLRVLGPSSSAADRAQVAARLARSVEGTERRAALAYLAFVGRAATDAERAAGGSLLRAGGFRTLSLDVRVLASDAAFEAAQG